MSALTFDLLKNDQLIISMLKTLDFHSPELVTKVKFEFVAGGIPRVTIEMLANSDLAEVIEREFKLYRMIENESKP